MSKVFDEAFFENVYSERIRSTWVHKGGALGRAPQDPKACAGLFLPAFAFAVRRFKFFSVKTRKKVDSFYSFKV